MANPRKIAEKNYKQALINRALRKTDAAMECLEQAVAADPSYAPAYMAAAEIFQEQDMGLQALDCYGCAMRAEPENILHKDGFIGVAQGLEFSVINEAVLDLFIECLETPGTNVFYTGAVWADILSITLGDEYAALKKQKDYDGFIATLEKMGVPSFLTSRLFLAGLKRLRVPDIEFERFLAHLRRCLLENAAGTRADFSSDNALNIAKHLAHYCHSNDYVFLLTEKEEAMLDALRRNCNVLENSALSIAILACYNSLSTLPNFEDLLHHSEAQKIKSLLDTQVVDFVRQKNIREKNESLTGVKDEVSRKVQNQYEALPYPRWDSYSKTIYNETIEGPLRNKKIKILNAGSGTGHEAVELATVFPKAQILAIDLSRASLAYATQKAEELGLKNLAFKQADILGLDIFSEEFDFIASSGVLHHMNDPFAGWKTLTGCLKRGGLMRIALYSQIGRTAITEARDIIHQKGMTPDPQNIRRFRHECTALLKPESYKKITASLEFYGLSECTDLLFHAQEHQLTLPQIKDWIKQLGLDFLGFQLRDNVLQDYRKEYSNDQAGLNLDNWSKFEQTHPETFIGMYRFWCRKKH